jgi:hypothetical protein
MTHLLNIVWMYTTIVEKRIRVFNHESNESRWAKFRKIHSFWVFWHHDQSRRTRFWNSFSNERQLKWKAINIAAGNCMGMRNLVTFSSIHNKTFPISAKHAKYIMTNIQTHCEQYTSNRPLNENRQNTTWLIETYVGRWFKYSCKLCCD